MADRPAMHDVILKAGRDRSLRRRHPWLMSGSIARLSGSESSAAASGGEGEGALSGQWARVLSAEGEVLAFGHLSLASSIRVRILSFGPSEPGEDLIEQRIAAAVARRRDHPLIGDTDALRLINAEGDGLPGLVVDRFADQCVVKLTSAGMVARRDALVAALRQATGCAAGYERADARAARREGVPVQQGVLWGPEPGEAVAIRERDRRFAVDVASGQKTGFYLDQRDSRDLVCQLAAGRRVLDLFSYTGGFAVAAARGGARRLTLVDSSAPALGRAEKQLSQNAVRCPVQLEKRDAFTYLREVPDDFDLLVLDPPPLARHRGEVAKASRAYKDLLLHAFRRAAPGALVLAFSCSHHVGADLFRKIAFGASIDAGRSAQVLRVLGAPADHPVALDHPEGVYLSGLLLQL